MKRSSQRGIALVITLIMLAVVTLMALVFLGISRRERASVTASNTLIDARYMADMALARAQAEVIGRIASRSNLLAYDFLVSTNFVYQPGFVSGSTSLLNVAYWYPDGSYLQGDDFLQNLKNLYFDPRVPVFITTNVVGSGLNATRQEEFRYYLDLNRNARFDTNGYQPVYVSGRRVGTNYLAGDPEWIGVLQHPDEPHSGTNRFVGRYAFVALPAGKSLDVNFIHNSAKVNYNTGGRVPLREGYLRNQGYGSYEMNLAAFWQDLIPAAYEPLGNPYHYNTNLAGVSSGAPFDDALDVLTFRYADQPGLLASFQRLYPATYEELEFSSVDVFSRGPLAPAPVAYPRYINRIGDLRRRVWAGSENPNTLFQITELLDTNRIQSAFRSVPRPFYLGGRLLQAGRINRRSPQFSSDLERSVYRLMSQMGGDSLPANRGKLNLNYVNVDRDGRIQPQLATNFVPWSAVAATAPNLFLFTNAAQQLLRSEYGSLLSVNYIPVWPTNEYTARVHQLLQIAANLCDATRTNAAGEFAFPSVFRPVFRRSATTTNVFIAGYREVGPNEPFYATLPWIDPAVQQASLETAADTQVNIPGVPAVIGARKGLPNFNEYMLQTTVQITRRLAAFKNAPKDNPVYYQAYELGISNYFGLEAWNSYTSAFPRAVSLYVKNEAVLALSDSNRVAFGLDGLLRLRTNSSVNVYGTNNWAGQKFQLPLTNLLVFVPQSGYLPAQAQSLDPLHVGASVVFDKTPGYRVPDLKLNITNRVVYALTDIATGRLLDYVNLDGMNAGFDISRALQSRTNRATAGGGAGMDPGAFWNTNRVANVPAAMTWGLTNQIFVSTNDVLSQADWRSFTEDPATGKQKEKAIDSFRLFLGMKPLFDPRRTLPPATRFMQVPFSPSRKIDQQLKWQANDPLVHYHVDDLYDDRYSSTNIVQPVIPPGTPLEPSNLGLINERYQPWGGRPGSAAVAGGVDTPLFKDPMVRRSDDWDFPSGKFANIGWLGGLHRGTPWQTIYLKSFSDRVLPPAELAQASKVALADWLKWVGGRPPQFAQLFTFPTNDWRIPDLFTVALNDNASRGLLSVNQTNLAAWSAVLSGVLTWSNNLAGANVTTTPTFTNMVVEPGSAQLWNVVTNMNSARSQMPGQVFRHLGDVLATPALTLGSPFLNRAGSQAAYGITDAAYERIPHQILSLLKEDEPYLVIYAYGQSLRPADRSIVTRPGPFFNLCTNYQVAGEYVTKTALRIEQTGPSQATTNTTFRAVVESFNILPTD